MTGLVQYIDFYAALQQKYHPNTDVTATQSVPSKLRLNRIVSLNRMVWLNRIVSLNPIPSLNPVPSLTGKWRETTTEQR
jgi:hypothetical protein